ncbi:MAG TPA: MFS transporter [Myxococcales bacterium]|nr:MFS transporter [Myxococcales bacterium]
MDRSPAEPGAPGARAVLPRAVVALGAVSLLTDVSSEMIFSLLPAFLAAHFPGAPLVLGAMEGLAELVSSALKLLSGRWADRARSLKRLVAAGYVLSAVARPLMAVVTRWWQPLLVRSVDRVGKGIRTSPRDALISRWVPVEGRARAFSFHRGMDHLGAALGAAVAMALTGALHYGPEQVFVASAVPGAAALVALGFTRDAPAPAPAAGPTASAPVPRSAWRFLVPVALFGLANSTDAFLLLKLTEQGAPATLLPFAWLLLHAVKSLVSYPAGSLADRVGAGRVVVTGWLLYAASYAGLALSPSVTATLGVIAFYGLYHALSEGAEKALLASLAPPEAHGRAFGLYHSISGVAALAAGLLFGAVWSRAGSAAAFLLAGSTAAGAAALLLLLRPRPLAPAAG